MDITELALMLGEVKHDVKETKSLVEQHLKVCDERIKPLEAFVSRTNRVSTVLVALGTGVCSLLTLKWLK